MKQTDARRIASPPLDLAYVEAVVRKHYGFQAHALHLSGDRDENFRIYGKDAVGHVFKVLSPRESVATADLLPTVLLHLERVAPELPVPRIVRTLEGHTLVKFIDLSGTPRIASLCTFLPGKLLLSTTHCSAQRRACGELLARLAGALRTFDHQGSRREVAWDIAQIPKLAHLMAKVPDLPSVRFLREFVARFTMEIAPRLGKLRHQFVHNDFSVRNIIVDPHEESRVVGIIDFGDAVHTALICDVAVGATGQLAIPETANEAVHDFVEAYCQIEPLQKEELALLNWLIAGRIVMNVVLTAWRRIENRCSGHIDGFDSTFFGWRIEFAKRLVYSAAR